MKIRSMTGFGRSEFVSDRFRVSVEMKAVNHRYLDLSVKMPRRLNPYEAQIRSLIKELGVERGKVDLYIQAEDFSEGGSVVRYRADLAANYAELYRRMTEDLDLDDDLKPSTIAHMPDVFTLEQTETDEEELWQVTEGVIREATARFVSAREAEGARLCADLFGKLDGLKGLAAQVEARQPEILSAYEARLTGKMKEMLAGSQVDESRIATEVAVFADKICTDEETVRLKSHIEAVRQALTAGGPIGRKLDFLAQEMNREANTILSKANDLISADIGIGMKTEIEKIREQIQNIE